MTGSDGRPKGRLLVVDDDEMNRDMLSRRLAAKGYAVETAENGAAALDRARSGAFDLVLLDIMMPGIDGLEVLKILRGVFSASDLPIIMATARGDSLDIVEALRLGANDYITKPLDFPVALARVQTQLSLKRAREELQAAHRKMKRDLQAAARIQEALLPTAAPAVSGPTFAWRYRACEELAGDSLNLFALDDRHVCLYLFDVSGHGVPSSLLAVSVSRSLTLYADRSSLVREPGDGPDGYSLTGPAEVARRLNVIYPMTASGDAHLYFTLVYGILDAGTGRLRLVVAGHPLPLVLRRDGPVEEAGRSSLPIGLLPAADYDEADVDLERGDRLYVYSDGLCEERGRSGEEFGIERLRAAIVRNRGETLERSLDAILAELADWSGGDQFKDDVSILAVEMGPAAGPIADGE
jgi:sigma-B regulation protein RsbU (phosphoserine phosphatase)